MIKIKEIREMLEQSQNPLVFFDDDPDGLCSFLLLEKKYKKIKGVVLKNSPAVDESYITKVRQYCPDLILVLDKPMISEEFIEKVHVPLIWIDHHSPDGFKGGVNYFNPRVKDDKDNRPVTYWCYKITNENLWIAMIGIVGDWHLSLYSTFKKKFKDMVPKRQIKNPPEVLFDTNLGKLVRIFSFILKGRTKEVYNYINLLLKVKGPEEILFKKSEAGKKIYDRYAEINKIYEELLDRVINETKDFKFILFTYSHKKYSFTTDMSNELVYKYPDSVVLIAREQNDEYKGSIRSTNLVLTPILSKALKGLEGQGGGHDHACGFHIKKRDFIKFKNRIERQIK